ncbi:MAG TPA: hypothetical protein VG410_11995 [Solirubrobacteraceae bacterium]|nr:hypothetical protein [Solirubrobacteraceae bacterium]
MAAGVALLALPASALAGTFTWSQPGDLNSSTEYGVQSWSYAASGATLTYSSSFIGNAKTLAGYTNSTASPSTWIAAPTSGSPRPLELVPAAQKSVTLKWTSPFSTTQTVNLSGSISEPNSTLVCGTAWAITSATPIASGTGSSGIGPTAVTVAPGGTIALTVTDDSTLATFWSTRCDETDVSLSLSAPGTAPSVTITQPTAGVSLTSESFAGTGSTGFGNSSQVTVRVCSGTVNTCPAGSAAQTLTASVQSNGSWSASPSLELQNGTYTVEAEQDDLVGDAGVSNDTTFTLNHPAPPTVTINSPGSAPLTTATPTLSGTAGTASGDSSVLVVIYGGTDTSGSVLRTISATVNGSGQWSTQVSPSLANGTYTAVASQFETGGLYGLSSPVTFTIQASASSGKLTLTQPGAGASVPQGQVLFAGSAATASGDSRTVTVTVWKGESTKGTRVGTTTTTESGGSWSTTWPHQLASGLYTARASQSTPQGAVTSAAHTFQVVPGSGTIGNTVRLTRGRVVTLSVRCMAASGQVCTGTVLVVTAKTFQPTAGGPRGGVLLAFARVSIPAGHTVALSRTVSRAVWRTLHKQKNLKVHVITQLSQGAGQPVSATVTRTLKT